MPLAVVADLAMALVERSQVLKVPKELQVHKEYKELQGSVLKEHREELEQEPKEYKVLKGYRVQLDLVEQVLRTATTFQRVH
jgi:type III secretory pathway component EscU